MQNKSNIKSIFSINLFLIIFSSALLVSFASKSQNYSRVDYKIEEASKLYIEGTSNVNSFSCFSKDSYSPNAIKMDYTDNDTMYFANTFLQLRTDKLDCNNSRMNKDLCSAMKSDDYPYIKVELHQAWIVADDNPKDEWINLKANATLYITNVNRKILLDIKAQKLGNNKYRFLSSTEMLMTNFNIEPPTALFGLIKVHNKIKINFDLITSVELK